LLFDEIKSQAKAKGDVVGLRLYVERDNNAARSTYSGLGMKDAGYGIFETNLRD